MNSLGNRYSRPQLKLFCRPIFKVLHFFFVRLPHAASLLIRQFPLLRKHSRQFFNRYQITYLLQILVFKMSSFRICGPKMAVFGTCLSAWGIIQLSFMALAFYSNSVAFVEDLPESAFTTVQKVANITRGHAPLNKMLIS